MNIHFGEVWINNNDPTDIAIIANVIAGPFGSFAVLFDGRQMGYPFSGYTLVGKVVTV